MRFIQRAPRLVKPLELKKRPAPKKREMVRKRVVVRAKPMRITRTVASIGGIPISIGKIYTEEDMGIGVRDIDIGAEIDVNAFRAAKEPENVLSMRDEMLSVQDLDTGRYRAMVIQDQANKKNIKGYLHLANVYSQSLSMLHHKQATYMGIHGGGAHFPDALPRLVMRMNEFTGIKTDLVDPVHLDSRELFKLPWLYISGPEFVLTDVELQNIGEYLVAGGFIVADGASTVDGSWDICMRRMFKGALAKVNRRCEFVKITGEHPIYHCYFDFDMPPGSSGTNGNSRPDYMAGIYVDGRLAGVITYNGLGWRWGDFGFAASSIFAEQDATRYFQFGVNLIVFALTQKGSITNRLMDTISVK